MNFRYFLLITILLLPVFANSQKLPTKQLQYNFLKWYLKYKNFEALSDTTAYFDLALNETHSIARNTIRSLKLTGANIIYIKRQNVFNNKSILDTTILPRFKGQVKGVRPYISLPIFSINKKIVLISWGYYCGPKCGQHGIEAYIKTKDGKWRPSKIPMPIGVF